MSGDDPFIAVWKVAEGQKFNDIPTNKVSTNCAIFNSDGKTLYASGNDKMLKEITDAEPKNLLDCHAIMGPLAFTNSFKMLFTGVCDKERSSGAIRCFKTPIIGNFTEHQVKTIEML